jgi:hypothetical protein
MTITNNWQDMIASLSKTRQVIVVEMQRRGRTADIKRDFSHEYLADDIATMLDYLKIDKADLIGSLFLAADLFALHWRWVRRRVASETTTAPT